MKRMHDTSYLTELLVRTALVAALAALLLLPMTVTTNGTDAAQQIAPTSKLTIPDKLKLSPIPHLETTPWLLRERTRKIDTLLSPRFEVMGPATVRTGVDERIFSLNGGRASTSVVSRNG